MGTRKTVVRSFEDSLGLDLTSSNLTRDPSAAIEFKNIERLPNGSYRGREGFKLAAQPLYIIGKHTYRYYDEETAETVEELICVGIQEPQTTSVSWSTAAQYPLGPALYRLRQESFTVNYSGSDTWGVEVAFDCDTNTLHGKIIENGIELLDTDFGLGTESSPVTLKTFADAVNALTDFTCFPPQTAVINGAYTGTNPTVDSGHTLSAGNWLFNTTEVTATAATDINIRKSATFTDNQVIGHGVFPAAILSLQSNLNTLTSSKTVTYYYWEPIFCLSIDYADTPGTQKLPLALFPFKHEVELSWYGKNYASEDQELVSFVTQNNCVYFSSSYASEIELKKVVGNPISTAAEETKFYAGVWKYDGRTMYLSGPVNLYADSGSIFTYLTGSLTGSSGLANGTYKYQFSFLRKDAQGNIVESFFEFIRSVTVTGGPKTVRWTFDNLVSSIEQYIPHRQFDMRATKASATKSTATTTFDVDADHVIRTGDTVFFLDNSGDFQERKVTAWTRTTITLNEEATIANTNVISIFCVRAWRTKASGAEYFLAKEVPYSPYISSPDTILDDDTADADLLINISNIKSTNIQYNFPRVNSLTAHQGLLAGGGGRFKNSILWEDPLNIESVDYARNVATVSADTSPQVSQLISSISYSLLATKENYIYEAVGSLGEASVETGSLISNSYGSSGAHTSIEIERVLYSVCNLGLAILVQNPPSILPDKSLLTIFRDCETQADCGLVEEKAILYWDSVKNWLHILLPFEDVEDDSAGSSGQVYYVPNTSTRHFVLQLPQTPDQQPVMSEFTYSEGIRAFPTAGLSVFDKSLFFTSRYFDETDGKLRGATYIRSDRLRNGNEADMFSDNGESYPWSFVPQWDDGDTPEYEKVWHEFELYQLQPDSFVAAFDVTFESFRDWVLTSAKRDTQRTLSFSASTTTADKIQFDPGYKAKRRANKLSGTVCKNPPVFTGYSYTVDDLERDKDKFGR